MKRGFKTLVKLPTLSPGLMRLSEWKGSKRGEPKLFSVKLFPANLWRLDGVRCSDVVLEKAVQAQGILDSH